MSQKQLNGEQRKQPARRPFSEIAMTDRPKIPEDYFNCDLCKNLLAPPIRIVDEIGNICGDCFRKKANENWTCIQNEKLEAILKVCQFSCKFQGCGEQIMFDKIKEHRRNCTFQVVDCLCKNCKWQGRIVDLLVHCRGDHVDLVIDSCEYEFDLSLNKIDNVKIFTNQNKPTVILKLYMKNNKIFHKLFTWNNSDKTLAGIKYSGQFSDVKLKCQFSPLDELSTDESEKFIYSDILFGITRSDCVQFKLKIGGKQDLIQNLLPHLECPVCKEILRSPIYMCANGHSFCHVCKPKLLCCPTCRGPTCTNRNYTLENLTAEIRYSCFYCDGQFLGNQVSRHEDACALKTYGCPICDYTATYDDFKEHCQHDHVMKIFDSNYYESVFDVSCGETCIIREVYHMFFTGNENNVYVLIFSHVRGQFVWSVRICNRYDERNRYFYEIGIVDKKRKRKMTKTEICSSMINGETFSKICFPPISFESYENGSGQLNYYCKIVKNQF